MNNDKINSTRLASSRSDSHLVVFNKKTINCIDDSPNHQNQTSNSFLSSSGVDCNGSETNGIVTSALDKRLRQRRRSDYPILLRTQEFDLSSFENDLPPIAIDSDLPEFPSSKSQIKSTKKSLSSTISTPSKLNQLNQTLSSNLAQNRASSLVEQLNCDSKTSQKSDGSSISLNSKQSITSVESTILAPIPTEQARTRSYIVGSITHQHSLLGHDELVRYFPNRTANIAVVTWNMCGKPADLSQLGALLLPESWHHLPDIYAIGVQEGPFSSGAGLQTDQKSWELQLQTTIGPSHVLLHSASYGVLHSCVFVRRDLIWFCSLPEHSSVGSKSSAANLIKTKGALGVCFKLFGSSILLVNCHLPAHERRNPQRIHEYKRICSQLSLPRNGGPLPFKYASDDVTERFDYVFWFGDLNFRVERQQSDIIKLLTQLTLIANPNLNGLLLNDQLIKAIQNGEIFQGFHEADVIRFLPTYKYVIGSNRFDDVSKRVPSWTDRILYRVKGGHAKVDCKVYDSASTLTSSDHKPVFALFEVVLNAGRDADVPLNAGLFNREIYVNGLQRRRQLWSQMLQNNQTLAFKDRKSNVCNLS